MGFLFVDRIEALDEHGARGALEIAPGEAALPPWLVLEAVGQLAAWVAMARTDFLSRPVAALVGEALLDRAAWCEHAEGPLALAAQLERIDGRAILYTGTASCGERVIARLSRCVGPLLPVALFDDPDAVRERLTVLRRGGTAVPRQPAPPFPPPQDIRIEHGVRRARLAVPPTAPYFPEHFPRRPVFPATLLAAALDSLAAPAAAAALGGAAARVVAVHDYKVRAFSEPGSALDISAAVDAVADGVVSMRVDATTDGKRTASGRLDYHVAP
jgi:3-hydroxymyristoyl/3-hydroxydecanoyl-(acyl carrier protein) dehydratase